MTKYFNVTGACDENVHYMVDLQPKLLEIEKLVNQGAYFVINRARQYGKTTILEAARKYLGAKYQMISLDFQMLSHSDFEKETSFVKAFASEWMEQVSEDAFVPNEIKDEIEHLTVQNGKTLRELFRCLSKWCRISERPVILIIDEVDSATNNQIFLDFLSQLRGYYIHRLKKPTFQSVILAGVYDIKNMKHKIREDEEHKMNSPWNIATDFNIDMSLDVVGIQGMLKEYEEDVHTGMNIQEMSQIIFDYTSGYPYLVSKLCKLLDEDIPNQDGFGTKEKAWSKKGFLQAVKVLLSEKNALFESLTGKLRNYKSLEQMIYNLLFCGKSIAYNPDDDAVDMAEMFGFVKNEDGNVVIANRLFEIYFYDLFCVKTNYDG